MFHFFCGKILKDLSHIERRKLCNKWLRRSASPIYDMLWACESIETASWTTWNVSYSDRIMSHQIPRFPRNTPPPSKTLSYIEELGNQVIYFLCSLFCFSYSADGCVGGYNAIHMYQYPELKFQDNNLLLMWTMHLDEYDLIAFVSPIKNFETVILFC